ncbi:hypothetical protein Q5H92_15495 [Hymenobacter sp. M29]|uniref:Uncharacterized protein n=1 Tax=Hymenobacter mellowenesis TaxID=3063995 RepID=A0ABT9AED2_9BACT|nr:hypothetical protein [Hymenobacter sp. M29]MDO7847772.1 hypothetical protein [Hymenobacter sp. M29]
MIDANKSLRLLQVWVGVLTLLVVGLLLALVYLLQTQRSPVLTAERINIVEPDGQLKMVISGSRRQHPGMLNGRSLPARERGAGLTFFNEAGDECGGLLYNGNPREASMVYSIDQFRNDQLMQLQYDQRAGTGPVVRSYGLKLWDRNDSFPLTRELAYLDSLTALHDTAAYRRGVAQLVASNQLGAERLFLGRAASGETGLFLRDSKGRVRLKIYIDTHDQPVMQLVDASGQPAKLLP